MEKKKRRNLFQPAVSTILMTKTLHEGWIKGRKVGRKEGRKEGRNVGEGRKMKEGG